MKRRHYSFCARVSDTALITELGLEEPNAIKLIFSLFVTFGSSLTVTEEVGWLQTAYLRPLGCNELKIHF